MAWSWKIGRIAGIDVFMHWTFLLLLAFIGYTYARAGNSWTAGAMGIVFVLALFGCVVLHELGHALAARRFGVPTRDITLLPIGGVARLQRIPEHPEQELVVAIAGPLVNVAIAIALAGLLLLAGGWTALVPGTLASIGRGGFFANLMWINVALVVFNMLPAFPMDGGRVLRALLAMRLEYMRATTIAAGVGQAMAIGFGLLGLLGQNPMLIFIALFVYLGAGAEAQQTQVRTLLGDASVGQAMLSNFRMLRPDDTLHAAARELLAGSQQDFPVLDGEQYVGMLFRKGLVQGLQEQGKEALVADFVATGCPTLQETDRLEPAMRELREKNCSSAAVFRGDMFVGLLTLENVQEYLMLQSAAKPSGH